MILPIEHAPLSAAPRAEPVTTRDEARAHLPFVDEAVDGLYSTDGIAFQESVIRLYGAEFPAHGADIPVLVLGHA